MQRPHIYNLNVMSLKLCYSMFTLIRNIFIFSFTKTTLSGFCTLSFILKPCLYWAEFSG